MLEATTTTDRPPDLDPLAWEVDSVCFRQTNSSSVAWELLECYGKCRNYQIPSGDLITVLPTSRVPLSYLVRDNWRKIDPVGNFRGVDIIERLIDGTDPALVVKSPERYFTKDEEKLRKGYPWWGGWRSHERRVCVVGNPVVEEQSIWEAIILLELHRLQVCAEVPEALVRTNSGERLLVVDKITKPKLYESPSTLQSGQLTCKEIRDYIRTKTDLEPEDLEIHNRVIDVMGYPHIIDVNRWLWPPYTDDYRIRLLKVISET